MPAVKWVSVEKHIHFLIDKHMTMKKQKNHPRQPNKTTGLACSVGIHLGLLVLALLPLISAGKVVVRESELVIPVDFSSSMGVPENALQAAARVVSPEINPAEAEPLTTLMAEEREPASQPAADHPVQIRENTLSAEVEREVSEAEVTDDPGGTEVKGDQGGAEKAMVAGEMQGSDTAGDGDWKAGLDGDGILTRKIIHREDITRVAEQDGVIAINVCVNRGGKVSAAKFNETYTTIADRDLIRRALHIVSEYRFETDISAPKRECGMLTFIFEVDLDEDARMAFADQ